MFILPIRTCIHEMIDAFHPLLCVKDGRIGTGMMEETKLLNYDSTVTRMKHQRSFPALK